MVATAEGSGGAAESVSEPYWRGAHENKLILQRCARCGLLRHYPRPLCHACYSFEVEPFEAERRGSIHSWTVTHHAFDPAFAAELPYVLVTVDILAGVRMMGRFTGTEGPRMGQPVELNFVPGADGVPIPHFTPATPQ
ncbi:MAG: hypothetical protein NVSMB17_00890 [Candidatus Dormibacteria bacterium]